MRSFILSALSLVILWSEQHVWKWPLRLFPALNFSSWWLLTAHRVSLNDYRSETLDRGENNPHNVTLFSPVLVKRSAPWHCAVKSWWWTTAARLWKSFHLQLLLYERVEKRISNADTITKNYRQRLAMNNNKISRKEIINLIVFDKISLGNGVRRDILKFQSYFIH